MSTDPLTAIARDVKAQGYRCRWDVRSVEWDGESLVLRGRLLIAPPGIETMLAVPYDGPIGDAERVAEVRYDLQKFRILPGADGAGFDPFGNARP